MTRSRVFPGEALDFAPLCRDGARSENLRGQLVMRRAAAARRRLLFCQNLGGRAHPLPSPLLCNEQQMSSNVHG